MIPSWYEYPDGCMSPQEAVNLILGMGVSLPADLMWPRSRHYHEASEQWLGKAAATC